MVTLAAAAMGAARSPAVPTAVSAWPPPEEALAARGLAEAVLQTSAPRCESVAPLVAASESEVLGVNDRLQLAQLEAVYRRHCAENAMRAGATLADPARPVKYPPIKFPRPVTSVAIHPHTAKDEDKISTALHRLEAEDPTFHSSRNPNTKELVISGMGDIHLAMAVDNVVSTCTKSHLPTRARIPPFGRARRGRRANPVDHARSICHARRPMS